MEGISEKDLPFFMACIHDIFHNASIEQNCDIAELVQEYCKELDPWLPIENAPKDRPIWLWNGVKHLAVRWNERNNDWWIAISFGDSKEPFTHYKELPEDPLF